ncbi:MAG: hypothetical protein AB9846_11585 [Tenuifilaceae bacterium]
MNKRISERKVIITTAGFIVLSGLVRLISFKVGYILFYLVFIPFIIYRVHYYYVNRSKESLPVDKYRLIVLVSMIVTILLNILGIQDVEFFLLFLLMIDFLLVINNKV